MIKLHLFSLQTPINNFYSGTVTKIDKNSLSACQKRSYSTIVLDTLH